MKGDIAFAGFMLTAEEWQELDLETRAQIIAVATRRADPWLERPRRTAEGTGPHEVIDFIDPALIEVDDEPPPTLDPECSFADLLDD
jgi:hypothetical protein